MTDAVATDQLRETQHMTTINNDDSTKNKPGKMEPTGSGASAMDESSDRVFQMASGGSWRSEASGASQEKSVASSQVVEAAEEIAEEGEDRYHTEDFISSGIYSENASFDQDPIELDYSYGYDCNNPNLCVVDPDVLLWYTGNILHVFDAKMRKLSFRRSAQGQDICFIIRSKDGPAFAVGESGGPGNSKSPVIIVYEWPDFKVRSVLKGGASRSYKCADFNCDGTRLASQADHPDDSLVVWDIRQRAPVITLQNPDPTVTKVEFSPYDPDSFITCGRGHIKFWRLIDTFTGQKIDCRPGRFGEFEDNDVSALYFLPDGRVVSNFRQVDLAIWRPNAMLELDFSMKNSEPCHSKLITFIQIYIEDNHVYTAGMDGAIRVWNYSYITSFYNDDQEESIHIDIDPSYERAIKDNRTGRIGVPVLLLPKERLEYPYHYYAQDARGGIWILDLELKKNPDPWSLIYISHAGPVNDISPSPADYYFATVGGGGKLNVYSHTDRNLFTFKQFDETPTSVLWLPLAVDPTGCAIVVGFSSGVLRVVAVIVKFSSAKPIDEHIRVVQTVKPHDGAVTSVAVNKFRKLLLTGSEDSSVFVYGFQKLPVAVALVPLAMVKMPAPVCHITWNPYMIRDNVAMATCVNGQAVEMRIRDEDLEQFLLALGHRESYVVTVPLVTTSPKTRSKKPAKYFSKYVSKSLVWIENQTTQHRYHNSIYLVGKNEPVAKLNISGGQTVQCSADARAESHMVLGLNNGRIKIIRRHPEPNNFTDTFEIVMHNTKSTINKLCFSHDYKILYSCGTDSGVFAYKVNFEEPARQLFLPVISELPHDEVEAVPELSLEQDKIEEKMNREREAHRGKVEKFKDNLMRFLTTYYKLIEFNKALPKVLRVPKTFFRLETAEERAREKEKMMEQDEQMLAPLRERQQAVFERVHKIKKYFIDPLKTPKFYLFAIREPYYLKSFPERKLFTEDPLGLTECDEENQKRQDRFEKLLTGVEPTKPATTEFERMVGKIRAKLDKEKEIAAAYEYKPLSKKGSAKEGATDDGEENVPDLITSAGDFLAEYDKFTPTEKHVFRRINSNRLKRLKCQKEMQKIGQLQKEYESEHDKIEGLFKNFLKAEVKDREVFPPVAEKLHDLLNLRQLIYFKKESFNKKLKELRKEKTDIITYYYWAQEEYKYMIKDMKFWGLDLECLELPPPLEVVWDLEYPDMLKFTPGPMPKSIAVRMERHKQEYDKIMKASPVEGKVDPVSVQGHLAPLLKYRQDAYKNAMITVRETLDDMIRRFDKRFLPLLLERSKASMELYGLKSEYVSTLQEVDTLYRFEFLQSSASVYKNEIMKIKHVYLLRENIRKKKLDALHEQTKECLRTIEDLNAKFTDMVKDDKWAKHLTRVYRRKFRPPKREGEESNDEDDESESSSDDEDIYDDEDEDDDDDESQQKIVAYMYDETIMPPGCDEDRFKQTFKFRAQRHVEETKMGDIRRERDKLTEEMRAIRRQIVVIEVLMAFFFAGTYRFQTLMKEEMDDIEYLVKLHPSQIQIFDEKDPFNTVPCLEDCRLIEQEDYMAKVKTMEEMKKVIQDMNQLVDKTQKSMKNQSKELSKLVAANAETERKIEHLLKEKFGKYVDVDEAQTFVLTEMIKKAIKRSAKAIYDKERYNAEELGKIDGTKQKEDILKTKKDRVKTLQTLYTIEAEKNRILADKLMRSQKADAAQKPKRDLNSEREVLKKKLKETEETEKKLTDALNDV